MHPILYPPAETAFETNGLGILPDALSCVVTEERNGIFELELRYPVSGLHYADLALRRLILAKPNPVDGAQPFRIYRITRPMDGVVTVYAQHISYDLAGIPAKPFTAKSAAEALAALVENAVTDCPFTFWTDKTTVAAMESAVPASLRSLLGGAEGSVLDVYGGEYAFDRYTVRLYGARGENRGVSIRYGKNLTSLAQDENCAAVYTGVYPYWTNADGALVTLPERLVGAPGTYDFTRILPLDLSSEWQEAPTQAQLRARAARYMAENAVGVPRVSLTVSFAQLEQSEEYAHLALLERVSLCDTVNVEFPALGVSATAKAIRTVYDALRGRYESVDLGDARATLADTIAGQGQQLAAAQRETKTFLQQAVGSATAQITGNNGGYVVLRSSTGGSEPDEILIMDQPSVAEAVQVWRWNKEGLGYSAHGVNGPYGLAMTASGAIAADFITAGEMNAGVIRTGLLQSKNGASKINLDTGTAMLTGSFESAASSANAKRVRGYMNSNGFFTADQNGQKRGIWFDTDGKIHLVVDVIEAVHDSEASAWGEAYARLDEREEDGAAAMVIGVKNGMARLLVSGDGAPSVCALKTLSDGGEMGVSMGVETFPILSGGEVLHGIRPELKIASGSIAARIGLTTGRQDTPYAVTLNMPVECEGYLWQRRTATVNGEEIRYIGW